MNVEQMVEALTWEKKLKKRNEMKKLDMEKIRVELDINTIPEELYDLLLAEFQAQHGFDGSYFEWSVSATKERE